MKLFQHLSSAWFNRQYRMTYRAVLKGLLASGRFTEATKHDLIATAHDITMLALKQYQDAEV